MSMTNPDEPNTPKKIAGFNTVELAAGVVVLIAGLVVALESTTYAMGTMRNVGPGIFPMLLGILLAMLGIAIIFEGRVSEVVAPNVPWRAILAICASLGSFALLIDRAGAFVAIFALIYLAGLADKSFRPVTLGIVSCALCAFITALVLGFRGIVNIDLLPGG